MAILKYKQNLIRSNNLIKDPLKSEITNTRTFMDFLIALFEISKKKQDGVTRKDMLDYLGIKSYDNIFEKRKVSEKYVSIVDRRPIKYYINDEGKKIVRLMYYFRDYYREFVRKS